MPVKDKTPEVTAMLMEAIDRVDLDGVLFRLTEIAYAKRNAQDELIRSDGGNKAEQRGGHAAGGILAETTDKIAEL